MSGKIRSRESKGESDFKSENYGAAFDFRDSKILDKYSFQASIGLNLREKMEELRNCLESLKGLDISDEGGEFLNRAIESTLEEVELVEYIHERDVQEESKVGMDVLSTFLEYAWSETQLAISKLWRAYKKWGDQNEIFFDLAKKSAEHKSLLELIKSNLDEGRMKYYPGYNEEKNFDWKENSNEEILMDLMKEENLLLDLYKRLGSLLDRDDIRGSCRGEKWIEYFEIFGKLVREVEENIDKLERVRRSILFSR